MAEQLVLLGSEIVDQVVVECTTRLFESTGCELEYRGCFVPRVGAPPFPAHAMASVLGYSGNQLRGCLTLVCVEEMINTSRPPVLRSRNPHPTPDELRDWAGELANQLLGRVKNQLRKREVLFDVGVPLVVSAELLSLPPFNKDGSPWHEFAAADGTVSVRLDLEVAEGWQLPEASALPKAGEDDSGVELAEGELLLF